MGKETDTVKVIGSDGKEYNRTKCQVFARCMGYIRPVSNYNLGKKSEMYSRKYFKEEKINNSAFLAKYMTAKTLEK